MNLLKNTIHIKQVNLLFGINIGNIGGINPCIFGRVVIPGNGDVWPPGVACVEEVDAAAVDCVVVVVVVEVWPGVKEI